MKKRLEAKVIGRVQMVMYRDFATRNARKLGITGYVMNQEDGSVSVVAEGEDGQLSAYLELLRKGSLLAHVESVSLEWGEARGVYEDFSIRYSKQQ